MKHSENTRSTFVQLILLTGSVAGVLMRFLAGAISTLTTGNQTSDSDSTSDIAPSGGVFNYRTGKLDDGMDPIGWYEED